MNKTQMSDELALEILRPLGVSVHQLTQGEMPGYMDDWGEHKFAEFKTYKSVTEGGDRRTALASLQRHMLEDKEEHVSLFFRTGSAVEASVNNKGEPEVYFEIAVAFCSTNNDLEARAAAKDSNRQVPVVIGAGFGFSSIPDALEQGFRCRRAGWHADAFIFLVDGSSFTVNRAPLLGIFPEGTQKSYGVHIDMNTGNGTIVPWNIAHESVMARDWEILPRRIEE